MRVGSIPVEKRYLTSTGEVVWALVNVSLVTGPEGQPSHFIAAIQDITERKQGELALREREEGYRWVIVGSGRAVRHWELSTDRLAWDRETAPPLDYQWFEVGETPDWWYERIHPHLIGSGSSRVWMQPSPAGRAPGRPSTGSAELMGDYAVVQDRASVVRDAEGRPAGVVAAMADVTQAGRGERLLEQITRCAAIRRLGRGCRRHRDPGQLGEPGGLG